MLHLSTAMLTRQIEGLVEKNLHINFSSFFKKKDICFSFSVREMCQFIIASLSFWIFSEIIFFFL